MITFKQYLAEQRDDTLVFAFGRYNPPTRGHILHFQAVRSVAMKHGYDYRLFISKTVDHKKNPVPVQDRVEYIKKAAPDLHQPEPAVNMFTIVEALSAEGYKRLVYVAGSDYFDVNSVEERDMLERLKRHAADKGVELTAVMSRQREPQQEISGTALRQSALNNDYKTFLRASPVGMGNLTEKDVEHMFSLTKVGLSSTKTKRSPRS